VDLIPGRLRIGLTEDTWHTVRGEYRTLTIVTDGLAPLNQREIIFSLQPGVGEGSDLMNDMMRLIDFIFEEACRGNRVGVGGLTVMSPDLPGFWGPDGFAGFLYAYPTPFYGSEEELSSHLAAVPVKREELNVLTRFGHTRVLAKLGERYLIYPFPAFGERVRPPVFGPGDMETSILNSFQSIECYDSCVWAINAGSVKDSGTPSERVNWTPGRATLVVGEESAFQLRGHLPKLASQGHLSLFTSVFPEITSCLVYKPGSSIPSMIRGPEFDARCAGNYVTVAQSATNHIVCVEDGFGVVLDNRSWLQLIEALETHRAVQFSAEGEFPGFELGWRDQPPRAEPF
jgi:hypothetical protein